MVYRNPHRRHRRVAESNGLLPRLRIHARRPKEEPVIMQGAAVRKLLEVVAAPLATPLVKRKASRLAAMLTVEMAHRMGLKLGVRSLST